MNPAEQKYDMNLLRVFVLVYETRSVTQTADVLFVSQPSVSYSLNKLRKIFADPLFHRGPGGLEPTPLASSVYPEMRQAIYLMDAAVRGSTGFSPASTRRTFRLMMTDLGLMALFPYIVRAVEQEAPEARIEVVPFDYSLMKDKLRRNEIDVTIGVPKLLDEHIVRDHLMDMPYIGLCSKSHPRMVSNPTIGEIAAESHIVVSNALGHEHVRHRLAQLGIDTTRALTLPHFAVLAQTLEVTSHISVTPLALADIFASQGALRQFELPFSVEPGHVSLYTYKRKVSSPAIEWLRQTIIKAIEDYQYPKYVEEYPRPERFLGHSE